MTTVMPESAAPVRRYVEHVMGMPVSLALRGRHTDDEEARAAWTGALAVLREADRVFSTYRADSAVSRLDRGETTPGLCPPEVAEVLALGERARRESGGAFDVRRKGPDGRPHLDPSGVVKGWAVERAARAFETLEDTDVCLSAGGDMLCRVVDPARPAWRVGVEDPHDSSRVLAVVPVWHGAVATSGLSRRGAHVTDPRDGTVPGVLASVTVVAGDLTSADIDATAALVLGAEAHAWLTARGRTGLLVHADGRCEVLGPSASARG